MIGNNQLAELEHLCEAAKEAADSFNGAVRIHAQMHNLDPQGLGRFIRAKVRDRLDKLEAEQNTVEQLRLGLDGEAKQV